MKADELHARVEERLAEIDQRYTPHRRALVEALHGAAGPLAVPDVLARRPELALSSAYRNLAVLEEVRAVRRVPGADDHARFELDEELAGHHHHLVCTSCGTVSDVDVPRDLERSVERAVARLVELTGFRTESHRLDLLGRCAACSGS